MNRSTLPLAALAALLLAGCFSIQDTRPVSPSVPAPAAMQNAVNEKKQKLQEKKADSFSLPDALGGVVSSDRWVVYQAKEEEVFEGNVSYDSGVYVFHSDYALSQRKLNRFTARGNVFLRKNNPDNSFYELYADKAVYNYKTGQGLAQSSRGTQVRLVYQTAKGARLVATAKKADFNTRQEQYILDGDCVVTHLDDLGQTAELKAERITTDAATQHLLLEGNAQVLREDGSLRARTIEYDGHAQRAYAYGQRPLAQGSTPDGTFAIIADRVEAESDTRKIKLSGRVQGWTVSDQVNASKANSF